MNTNDKDKKEVVEPGDKGQITVNTTANLKKAGVKKVLKKSGKATGFAVKKVLQWVLNVFLTLLLIGTISGIIIGATFFNYVKTYLIDEDYDIENLKTSLDQTTTIWYKNENGEYVELEDQRIYGTENRSWVSYSEMPQNLVNAFVAIEDERFWQHHGVDWKRTFGAVLEFVSGNDSYGGSTITQQLIKNISGEDDTTIQRKVTEIFRALSLSEKRSRYEILEMYLNTINLSRNNYGVQAAANYYFGKDVSELTLVECAALAAIPKSPTKYDPVRNPENNKERRQAVLKKMYELGWITEEEYNSTKDEDLVINITVLDGTVIKSNSYFKDALIEQIISDLNEQYGYSREYASNIIYSGGLRINATIDPEIQTIMEEVFSDPDTFQKVSDGIQPEAAMVVIDPYTGDVKGIVGGREKTGDRDLNRATQSKRQIGSSIKPLTVYAPAMDLGLVNYSTVVDDTPVEYKASIGRYWPVNAPNRYDGLITINRAIEQSKNTTAIKVLQDLTVDYSYNFAKNKLHLDSLVESDKDLAPLALGGLTNGLTVLEVAAAYSIFPNAGTYSAPRLYTTVLRSDGTVLLEQNIDQEYAISADTAAVMTRMLQNVVSNGTAAAITLDRQVNVAGKTGSTNDDKDRYFAGFTPYYVGACWFGYDTPKYLGQFSSNPAMIAWEKVMERIHQKYFDEAANGGEPLKTFDYSRLVQQAFCLDSGVLPSDACNHDLRGSRISYGWYTKSQLPKTTCETHVMMDWDSTTAMVATDDCPDYVIMQVALIKVDDRNFEHNIAITDARYTCRSAPGNPDNVINPSDPYYMTTMPPNTYPGYTAGVEFPQNCYCTLHNGVHVEDDENEGEEQENQDQESQDQEGENGETTGENEGTDTGQNPESGDTEESGNNESNSGSDTNPDDDSENDGEDPEESDESNGSSEGESGQTENSPQQNTNHGTNEGAGTSDNNGTDTAGNGSSATGLNGEPRISPTIRTNTFSGLGR